MAVRQAIGVLGKSGTTPVPVTGTTDTRMGLGAFLRSVTGVRPRSGKFRGPTGGNMNVTGSSAWAYSVEAGAVVVAPSVTSGAYIVVNDAAASVPTSAKPAAGSRIDIIYVGQADAWDRAQAATLPLLGCVQGVASTGTPAAPAIPDGTVELARNVMTSAATTTASAGNSITQTLGYTAATGAVTYYVDAAQRTADTGRGTGDLGFEASTARLLLDTAAGEKQVVLREDAPDVGALTYSSATWYQKPNFPTFQVVRVGSRIYLEGTATSTAAIYDAGATYTVATIADSAFRPAGQVGGTCRFGGLTCNFVVESTGELRVTMQVRAQTATNGELTMQPSGLSWTAKDAT